MGKHKWGTGDILLFTIIYLSQSVVGIMLSTWVWGLYIERPEQPGAIIILACFIGSVLITIFATSMIFIQANRISNRIAEQAFEDIAEKGLEHI